MRGSKRGRRGGRFALAGMIAALAVTVFGAGSARAALLPFHATFDDAALNVGVTFDILEQPDTATMTGTWDNAGSNEVSVPAASFVFPEFSGDAVPGVPVTVDFSANPTGPIVGTLNGGDMTLDEHSYHATVTLQPGTANEAVCEYDADLGFTTGDTSGAPFTGDPFTVGTPDVTITNGNLQNSWTPGTFTAVGEDCGLIDSLVTQSGGIAMGNGIDLTPETGGGGTNPAPTPVPGVTPKKKKCKKKKGKKGIAQSAAKCKKKKKK
jgi:hypothetical protein